jgi:hypothetical protein
MDAPMRLQNPKTGYPLGLRDFDFQLILEQVASAKVIDALKRVHRDLDLDITRFRVASTTNVRPTLIGKANFFFGIFFKKSRGCCPTRDNAGRFRVQWTVPSDPTAAEHFSAMFLGLLFTPR